MAGTPIYPGYRIDLSDSDSEAYEKNCVRFKLETLVPHELFEDFQEVYFGFQRSIEARQRGLLPSRGSTRFLPYADYLKELTDGRG